MPLRKEIVKGVRFLLGIQNSDGGIPATKPGDVSGCWTTGQSIEAFIITPYYPLEQISHVMRMVQFLIDSQIKGEDPELREIGRFQTEQVENQVHSTTQKNPAKDQGSWPLVVGGKSGSTMATGHCVAALALAEKVFNSQDPLIRGIVDSKERGVQWLHLHRNSDGGWGVEPNGSEEGRESRMVSTVYALRGYFGCGYTAENSKDIREGVQYIVDSVNEDGGWGKKVGEASDPSNTARAVIALIRSGVYASNSRIISNALKYIKSAKPKEGLWKLQTETYIVKGAPGQTIYNSNSPYDVLESFLRAGINNENVKELIGWYVQHQEDDGRWHLGSTGKKVEDISTWSTNEAIQVLDLACEKHLRYIFENYDQGLPKRWRYRVGVLSVSVALLLLYVIGAIDKIGTIWQNFSENTKEILLFGIGLALIIEIIGGIAQAELYERFKKWRKKKTR